MMTIAEARPALIDVMERFPDLTIDGLGGNHRPRFNERRADLMSEIGIEEFVLARMWLELIPVQAKPNMDCDSYLVKHVIEEWIGAYVSNGATIAAAVSLNLPLRRCPSGINGWIGIAGHRKWPA